MSLASSYLSQSALLSGFKLLLRYAVRSHWIAASLRSSQRRQSDRYVGNPSARNDEEYIRGDTLARNDGHRDDVVLSLSFHIRLRFLMKAYILVRIRQLNPCFF